MTEKEQDKTHSSCKRILLYAHYDRDGQVDPHVLYQIKALYDFGISIIFISNSPVKRQDAKKLAPYIVRLHERPDEGYDWTAWKEVILEKSGRDIYQYDECIIMNDSCYGPFFPLGDMFETMRDKEVDFWAITQNTDINCPNHLQPYFCVFKKSIFHTKYFLLFWRSLPKIKTKKEAITFGELKLSRFFEKYGFHYSVYSNYPFLPNDHSIFIGLEEPFVYSAASWLVRFNKTPFAKIQSFRTAFGKPFSMGSELFSSLKYTNSVYPHKLILNHIRRTRPCSWHKNLPDTLQVLDTENSSNYTLDYKIAVFAHLFYMDQVEESIRWISNIPFPFDLYVSTSSSDSSNFINKYIKNLKNENIKFFEVRIMEDRGRDVAPWILLFKDVHEKYDIALKFNIKKSPYLYPITAQMWNIFLLRSVLASQNYVTNIIQLFTNNESLGIAFHSFPPSLLLSWPVPAILTEGDSESMAWQKKIFERLNVRAPEETTWPLCVNNIFWYRPKALHSLIYSNISIEDFPQEPLQPGSPGTIAHGMERALPYIIQNEGYEWRNIIPKDDIVMMYQHYEDCLINSKKLLLGRWEKSPFLN